MAPLIACAVSALSGCSARPDNYIAAPVAGRTPITVTSATGMPYTFADGAQAKKQADALCGTGGVRTSIYDRFNAGTWIYPEGCA
jgi:hypothetical protein